MKQYILQLYQEEFLPSYLSETLVFDRNIFSRDDFLSVLGKERDSFKAIAKTLSSFIQHKPSAVLVSGTGSGALTTTLIDEVGLQKVIEIDINPAVISRRQRLNRRINQRQAMRADIQALPFADESFDLSIAYAVLRYVKKPHQAVDELLRTLHPSGLLVIGEGRKYHIVEEITLYIQHHHTNFLTENIEVPNVALPNLTFAYFLHERSLREKDMQLKTLIASEMGEHSINQAEAIMRLAESSFGSLYMALITKQQIQ